MKKTGSMEEAATQKKKTFPFPFFLHLQKNDSTTKLNIFFFVDYLVADHKGVVVQGEKSLTETITET